MTTRHQLMAVAERAIEEGASGIVLIYYDAAGLLTVVPCDDASEDEILGLLLRAQHFLLRPAPEEE